MTSNERYIERDESEDDDPENQDANENGLSRRMFIKATLIGATAGFIGATSFGLFQSLLAGSTSNEEEAPPTFIYYASSLEMTENKLWYIPMIGEEIKVEDFKVGDGAYTLWRGSIPAIVIKLETEKVKDPTGMIELEDGMMVAYFAKCTHLCCIPGWKKDLPDLEEIYCPCHEGHYDAYDNGKVLSGPPPAPLPKIPLVIEDGKLVGVAPTMDIYQYCGPV